MDQSVFPPGNRGENGRGGSGIPADDWAPLLARTLAHLAAQLTMTQIRLRALATELSARSVVDADAVRERAHAIAAAETGAYLRENLGDALVDLIDVEVLEAEIIAFFAE